MHGVGTAVDVSQGQLAYTRDINLALPLDRIEGNWVYAILQH